MTINRNLAKFAPSINTSGKAAVATITVTVAGGKYVIDGTSQQTISLSKGITYRFDNSDSSNSGHPLRFSTTSNGTHASGSQFTTGITTVGTAGSTGAYVEVTLEQDVADTLYTYCPNHSNMGGTVKTAYGNSNVVEDTSPQLGGNLDVNGNDIVSTSNANIDIIPHGTGDVNLGADTVMVGDNNANATITTQGTGDLTLNTNSGTNSGTVTIADGANGDISITPNGSGKVIIDGLSHPTADGSANQVIKTDGSGNLSFTTMATGGLGNISEDTSPQLGGDLDVVTHGIVSTSNRNIAITPNGSGKVVLDGISHPTADGTNGQALVTNGSGVLSFSTISGGSGGGATGGGSDEVFYENDQAVTTNYSISASHNAMSAGPITVNNGITVTVPSGVRWVVV
tara:strand:- start:4664 stop:5860 length:1197 start_codon:yes stop_codon:yes gene_type:complete